MRRENLDPKDPMDHQDPEACQEREVTLVPSALWALLDLPVLMVNLESRESLESRARKETLGLQDLRDWPVPTGRLDQSVLLD